MQESSAECSSTPTKFGGVKALCHAIYEGDVHTVDRLSKDPEIVNTKHPMGWAPIHLSIVSGDMEIVKLLLSRGAEVNAADMYSAREMDHRGLLIRNSEFSRLIHPKADTKGFTPLHYAVCLKSEPMIRLLLDSGADVGRKSLDGRTALDVLEVIDRPSNYGGIRKLLVEYSAALEEKIREEERQMRLRFPLEQRLKQRLVGQLAPIHAVAAAVRRKQNGWHDEDHPLVFLFLGSSGIGKTELAKGLADYLHPNDESSKGFIRIDMSEFQTKHEVAKFIGSPPGYIGHEAGGQLTEKLEKCPNAVVLLDEVEKAHPDVLTIMLQLFDEGRLTDGKGQTVVCRDAIFVMTSNLASDVVADAGVELRKSAALADAAKAANEANPGADITTGDKAVQLSRQFCEKQIRPILKEHFKRDEFLGRINEIMYFLPFSESELKALVKMELDRWAKQAHTRHQMKLEWTDDVIAVLAKGHNVRYGARSIKHEVEKRVVNQLADAHERGVIDKGYSVLLFVEDANEEEQDETSGDPLRVIKIKYHKETAGSAVPEGNGNSSWLGWLKPKME